MKSPQFMLVLNGTLLVDCCEERKRVFELNPGWTITKAMELHRLNRKFYHCGMGCIRKGKEGDQ